MEKCCVCKKGIKNQSDEWICESCDNTHHPKCSGYYQSGSGEYPSEDELSICQNCTKQSPDYLVSQKEGQNTSNISK